MVKGGNALSQRPRQERRNEARQGHRDTAQAKSELRDATMKGYDKEGQEFSPLIAMKANGIRKSTPSSQNGSR